MPKLILLNGSVGIGKSTLTARYLHDHALALGVDGDALMGMLGQWLTHEDEARAAVFSFIRLIVVEHLKNGHDVLTPYLLLDAAHAEIFAAIAAEHNAQFYEILLDTDREEGIRRAIRRGKWGEPGSPPLTAKDRPILEDLYDRMMEAVKERPHTVKIQSVDGEEDTTYQEFLAATA